MNVSAYKKMCEVRWTMYENYIVYEKYVYGIRVHVVRSYTSYKNYACIYFKYMQTFILYTNYQMDNFTRATCMYVCYFKSSKKVSDFY